MKFSAKKILLMVVLFAAILLSMAFNRHNLLATGSYTAANKKLTCVPCSGGICKLPARALAAANNTPQKITAINNKSSYEMKLIPGGTFKMGSDDYEDSKPVHAVTIGSFLMDEHEVTNIQFEKFVNATAYVTIAERPLNPKDFAGVPIDKLVPGAAVFTPVTHKVSLQDAYQWWVYLPGANWRHPAGPASSVKGKENEPVVQVCYEDAAAYAKWAGKRLPTEAEWEFAARAGRPASKYYWGDQLKPNGKWTANIYQGSFPDSNTKEDGYAGVAPVKSFAPNPYGLYDMDGNVWEWCSDFYQPGYYKKSPAVNPKGPVDSYDTEEPGLEKHVQRGGSFICSDQYCNRYKAGSRGKGETSSAGNNLGFRCVKEVRD
jgi:formylglycine-generating enzyme